MTTPVRTAQPFTDPRLKGNVWTVFEGEKFLGNFALREGDGAEEAIAMSYEAETAGE
ncbi:hypothetical protein [Parvibaculum sp.]|uniref:hypothetical protein n=1 Tax=Parvibaculum sp. TaxID=2024848 RepID=UPI001E0F70B2|nr:hypothetical protein [Parvibaculum sp.]MBX3490915.1 hypothetical protein [Parvibaculum sp.]